MILKDLIANIDIWDEWKNNYKNWVPMFIHEATTKENWSDWDKDVFYEYFERSYQQCVSSLKQGYFTNDDKQSIKNNWKIIGPLLKKIAESQDEPLFDEYEKVKKVIRQFTENNQKAATNRLIAGLQPKLLCTVIHEGKINQLIRLLNEKLEHPTLSVYDSWFKNSYEVLSLYKESIPYETIFDIATLPWQTFEYLSEYNIDDMDFELVDDALSILKYKKQIVLQGPPGTGKTRLAKELAKELATVSELIDSDVLNYIKPGIKLKSAYDKLSYEIKSITGNTINIVNSEKGNSSTTIEKVKEAFIKKVWKGEQIKAESDSYSAAVAKHLHTKLTADQLYLIQFHPSYSYEDFVRGIVAESNGDAIQYNNVNKILAKVADLAAANWKSSQKDSSLVSKENRFDKYFDEFVQVSSEELAVAGKIPLTPRVDIINIDADAFRYKGESGWAVSGNRMLFKDIKKAYLDGNRDRKDILNNNTLSGLAIQHATYYAKVLNRLYDFLDTKQYTFDNLGSEKAPLKNYVLIIDEINRANLSSVLGELIYALEYRGEEVETIYEVDGDKKLILPPNFYIIGTMNTADRSVGHIDYAIRRRFAFVPIPPKDLSPELGQRFKVELFNKVAQLFRHDTNLSKEFDANDVQLGHSYFIQQYEKDDFGEDIKDKLQDFELRLQYEIIPILLEYVNDGILIGKVGDLNIKTYIKSLSA